MIAPRIRVRLASASAVAVLASLLVVGPVAADACATHPVNVRLSGFANGPQDVPPYYWDVERDGTTEIQFNAFGHDCSGDPTSLKWSTVDGTAVAPEDYDAVSGKPEVLDAINDTEDTFREAFVGLNADSATEAAVQSFKVKIDSSPHGTLAHGYPIEAPVHLVDDDGSLRVGFPAGVNPTIRELDGHFAVNPDVQIPVFRAGPTTSSVTVNYSIAPSSDDGFTDLTNGSVTIPIGGRHATIKLAINRDDDGTDETPDITLTGASGGAALAEHTTATVTIDDNYFPGSDTTPPTTSFHHPLHNRVYKRTNPLARTIHVFAPGSAQEPAGIDWARTALRRTKKNGSCQWWNGNGWSPGACTNNAAKAHSLPTKFLDAFNNKLIYEYPTNNTVLDPLKPSMGTKIKNYFVYGWARDNLGNEEDTFQMGRNKNRFEVKKG